MKTKISPAVVGAFVLGAFALGVISLLAFGSLSFLTRPERFMVYFDESVHGLDLGAPVKLRGVRVGRVVDLSIRYDPTTNGSLAAVVCELDHDRITDEHGAVLRVAAQDRLKELVNHGLRAQLGVAGLATGLLFVELDFLDPKQYPEAVVAPDAKYVVVPSVPSALSGFQSSISNILGRLQAVDFQGLSVEIKRTVTAARVDLEGVDVKGLVAQWRKTGESVDALARSPEVTKMLVSLDRTLEALRGVMAKLEHQVDTNGDQLKAALAQTQATLKDFDAAALTARRFVDSQQNLGADADRALARLADAAEEIQRLADFLERNPSALISGRKPPPSTP